MKPHLEALITGTLLTIVGVFIIGASPETSLVLSLIIGALYWTGARAMDQFCRR